MMGMGGTWMYLSDSLLAKAHSMNGNEAMRYCDWGSDKAETKF